uniref:Uncharacterized protein n=1 Tax=Ditylenchus dipsaci TaxID=166011 RepID=A0A915EQV4_9BILA
MLNNNNSQEDAESFEQAVCSFFQALHPDKEVESSTIPYHEVSKFITKLLDCHQFSPSPLTPASPLSPTLTNGYIYDHHQQEFPKISQTFNIEQHHFMFEHMSASHQATGPEDVKVDKRTIQYKLAHKLPPTGNKGECVAFDCHESGLLCHFEHFLKKH